MDLFQSNPSSGNEQLTIWMHQPLNVEVNETMKLSQKNRTEYFDRKILVA